MSEKSVGVGELRQNLSKHLRRVQRGERLIVTDRNRPIASLAPLLDESDPLARMIADGRATPPTKPGPLSVEPINVGPGDPASRALEAAREERR